MRYQAEVEYDGTAYFGYQRQKGQPSIQESIEKAISNVSDSDISLRAAGRTDSGVHATGQVIAFDLEWRHSPQDLRQAINSKLPVDIAIRQISETNRDFHPRFHAKSRTYQYHIYNGLIRSPLTRLYAWHVVRPLDVQAMNRASSGLIGSFDFGTFGRSPQGTNTVREVFQAGWQRDGEELYFTIEANAFLFRMVRTLVGSMKLVGEGSWQIEQFLDAFAACDRSRAAQPAPACGLYLLAVRYD